MAEKQEIDIIINVNDKKATESIDKVTKSTKKLGDEATTTFDNFGAFGVTIGGVKSAFAKVIPTAKKMFGSIKAGLISTGIGAFVVIIGSLVTYLTQTKKGAELLEQGLAIVGATIGVLTDRISMIGGAVTKFFKGDFKGAANDVKDAFTDIGTEIANDVKLTNELTKSNQKLRDAQRDLNVEVAQQRAEVEALKFIAEDTSQATQDRLDAAKNAFDIENSLMQKQIDIAEEMLENKRKEVEMSESTAEDLDELAELEINLANIRGESFGKQIGLNNLLNTIKNEQKAKDDAAHQKELDDIQATLDAKEKQAEEEQKILDKQIADQKTAEDERKAIRQKRLQDATTLAQAEQQLEMATFDAVKTGLDVVKGALKEGSKAQRNFALFQIGVDTAKAISTLVSGSEIAAAQFAAATGPAAPFTYAATKISLYATGLASIMGNINQAKELLSSEPAFASGGMVGGYGSGTSDSVSARLSKGESVINARSTSMFQPLLSAMNVAGGGVGFARGGVAGGSSIATNSSAFMSPVKTFVVTDEMTNSQNQLASIRRKATF